MARHAQLTEALNIYVSDEQSQESIPDDYYWDMIKAWHKNNANGHNWTVHQAAAALLHRAFNVGLLQPHALTPEGHQALSWADDFMNETNHAQTTI